MIPRQGRCAEQDRLIGEWHAATNTFAAAVSLLANAIGTTPQPEYERLRNDTEQARLVLWRPQR
jgi:hypothetical protein